jgi:hypothetical protein
MEGISNDQRRREGSFMGNMAFDKNSKTKVKMVVSPTVEAGDPSRVMYAPLVIQNGQESFEAIVGRFFEAVRGASQRDNGSQEVIAPQGDNASQKLNASQEVSHLESQFRKLLFKKEKTYHALLLQILL